MTVWPIVCSVLADAFPKCDKWNNHSGICCSYLLLFCQGVTDGMATFFEKGGFFDLRYGLLNRTSS